MISNAQQRNRLKVTFLSLLAILLSPTTMARGVGDGAGGGRAVFQAKAIRAILANTDLLYSFATAEAIQSIELVSANGGVSVYRIHTSLDCVIDATATADDDWASSYSVTVSPKVCRSGSDTKN